MKTKKRMITKRHIWRKATMSLAAAAMLGTTLTACDNVEDLSDNTPQQPQTAAGAYSVCIPATFGEGSPQTRYIEMGEGEMEGYIISSFVADDPGTPEYDESDDIAVYNITKGIFANDATVDEDPLTLLHPDQSGATANLTGTLKFYEGNTDMGVSVGDRLLLLYGTPTGGFGWPEQIGNFYNLSVYDQATATVKVKAIDGNAEDGYTLTTTKATFENAQSMFKFTFTGLPEGVGLAKVTIHSAQDKLVTNYFPQSDPPYSYGDVLLNLFVDEIRETNGPGVAYAALRFDPLDDETATDDIIFTVVGTDYKVYRATKASPAGGFENSKYYTSEIELTEYANEVELSSITQDYVAQTGDVLTGTLDGETQKYKISIAPGATVTLSGVTINGVNEWGLDWAGLTCLGDATIVLADGSENTVTGFSGDYPGIQAGPAGTTLTIRGGTYGTGTLTASCSDSDEGLSAGIGGGGLFDCGNITIAGGNITATSFFGAGIGSGNSYTCGDITISGGTVTALAHNYGAGIGCGGHGNCGTITISGGKVEATGGEFSAGIGCAGKSGTCGAITITNGESFMSVTATKGDDSYMPIGLSDGGDNTDTCGAITFGNTVIYDGGDDKDYDVDEVDGLYFSNINNGNTWTLTPQP